MATQRAFEVTLRDGTRALIRPIEPDDKWRLAEGLRRLSPDSRYQRFHAPVERLTAQQLAYLTEVDSVDHVAWVALDADALDEPGLGVARYVRLADEPTVAEAAVTVADEHQGKGVGSLLLAVLCRSAIRNGIRMLRNYVLVDNTAMLGIFDDLGAVRRDEGHGVYRVDMPLPDDPDDLPDTPAMRVLQETARRRLPPFRHFAERLGRGHQRADEPTAAPFLGDDLAGEVERELRDRSQRER